MAPIDFADGKRIEPPPRAAVLAFASPMNIHHLELFYYVATHGGISRAVRHMPYGIQQPAVSGQILQLEEELGTRLFERLPFKLTPAGEELFAAIKPFFDNLDTLAARISKKELPKLRIGAAELVLADYLPTLLRRLRQQHPDFKLSLHTLGTADVERRFSEHQVDVALSALDRRAPARLRRELLVRLPLALVVPRKSRWHSSAELWTEGLVEEPLICLPATEQICRLFHEELKRRKIDWPVAIEASSIALLVKYVENGYGIGVTVLAPELAKQRQVRLLPLNDFPPFELYAIWQGEPSALVQDFLDEVRRYAREEWPQRQQTGAP